MICFSTKRTWHKCIYTVLNLVFYEIAEWEYNNEFIIPYTDKRKKMCMHKISRYEGQGRVFCVLAVKIPIQLFSASFKYILWRFEFIIVHFMQLFILCWLNSSHNQFNFFFFLSCPLVSGAARGPNVVACATSVPARCGSAIQKSGSRGTPGMSLTTRSTTSSPSCLGLVSLKGHDSISLLNNHLPSD